MARRKKTTREKLQGKRDKLAKLTLKRSNLISKKHNHLQKARAKARLNFDWVKQTKQGIRFKIKGGEEVQTDQRQISMGKDPDEFEKYQKTEEKIKDTNEKIWETNKDINKLERKEKSKEEKSWNDNYWGNAFNYVKENGVDNNLLGRTLNYTQRSLSRLYNRPQGRNPTEPRQWLKYNRGRVK